MNVHKEKFGRIFLFIFVEDVPNFNKNLNKTRKICCKVAKRLLKTEKRNVAV